jgi:hypothetical protein
VSTLLRCLLDFLKLVESWKRGKASSKEETTMKEQDKGLNDKGKEDGRGR